jgi:hypothetical protein
MVSGTTAAGRPFSNAAEGFTQVYGYSAEGAGDRAYLYDSADQLDVFFAVPGYAYLSGGSFFTRVTDFDQVLGVATAGGAYQDVARLTASAGDDLLEASPEETTLKFNGNDDTFVRASGFYCVAGYASDDPGDGVDRANLSGSALGSDVLRAWPGLARHSGGAFYHKLVGFEQVTATSTLGDQDVARLFDSTGDDLLEASPEDVTLKFHGSEETFVQVSHFREVHAYSVEGGTDVGHLIDSASTKEFLRVGPDVARLYNDDFCNRLVGFEQVTATATAGGSDDATLVGSAGDDVFTFNGDLQEATLKFYGSDATFAQASGFSVVRVSGSSGTDQAELGDSSGNDIFVATDTYAVLRCPGLYYVKADSFLAPTSGYLPAGGPVGVALDRKDDDSAYLYGSTPWKALGDWENQFAEGSQASATARSLSVPASLLWASESNDNREAEAVDLVLETEAVWDLPA